MPKSEAVWCNFIASCCKRIGLLSMVALVAAMMMVATAAPAFAKPRANSNIQAKGNFCERIYTDNKGQQKKCFREECEESLQARKELASAKEGRGA